MEFFFFLPILAAVFFFAVVYNQQQLADKNRQATELAERLGLAVRGNDELEGRIGEVGVRMYTKDHGSSSRTEYWTHTRCTLPVRHALPNGLKVTNQGVMGFLADVVGFEDFQLGTDLDGRLRIHTQTPEETRELLTDSGVETTLWSILNLNGQIELSGRSVCVRVRGQHLENAKVRLDEALVLCRALSEVFQPYWQAVADAHGLSFDADDHRIEGVVDGIQLRIRLDPSGRTWVQATLPTPLPQGTRILHVDHGQGSVKLGDPILDTMVAVETSDPQALIARVSNEVVRGPLLELVHGNPGSEVRQGQAVFMARGRLGKDLLQATDTVLECARALEQRA